jgi:hypothetical protein
MKLNFAVVALVALGGRSTFRRHRIGNAACSVGTIERGLFFEA